MHNMNTEKHVLIVDDDEEIRTLVADFLSQYNYQISTAEDGKQMFDVLEREEIDLIILDLMLPGDDGLTLCKKVRETSAMPIIMLSAIGQETDRIIGLEMGADDYLPKPFNERELLARVKAIFRRTAGPQEAPSDKTGNYKFAGWTLDTATRCLLSPEDVEVSVSAGEYSLLLAFVESPQRVLSRDHLLDITKNREAGPFDRSIDVQISRLRHKIEEDPKAPVLIKTVRGGGYLFTANVEH
jgi:two-component system, OmpR family, response regulator